MTDKKAPAAKSKKKVTPKEEIFEMSLEDVFDDDEVFEFAASPGGELKGEAIKQQEIKAESAKKTAAKESDVSSDIKGEKGKPASAPSAWEKSARTAEKKIAGKDEKKRLNVDKKAALKQLERLKKQIKKGVLPSEPAEPVIAPLPDAQCYGEKLPYEGGFPVYCCKYVIIADGGRRVAMRFFNASDVLVTGVRFTLVEKDADGEVIKTSKLERAGLFAERGTLFAVADGEVSKNCVAVEVKVESVLSGYYEYVYGKDGEVSLRYGASDVAAEYYFKDKPYHTVKKRRRAYTLIAIFAVICIVALAVAVTLKVGLLDRAVPSETPTEIVVNG